MTEKENQYGLETFCLHTLHLTIFTPRKNIHKINKYIDLYFFYGSLEKKSQNKSIQLQQQKVMKDYNYFILNKE